MVDRNKITLVSGGHKGTEAEFGRHAERWGIHEVTYSFKGHRMERAGGELRNLSAEQLAKGDVSMEIVSGHMGRSYTQVELVRRVIQSMYHVVVSSYQVFAVGWIQPDGTVMGGTGWGVELAKFFNRPVAVFDQQHESWFVWRDGHWMRELPLIPERPFAATGTRRLTDAGRAAIRDLFERSFGPAPERPLAPAKPSAPRKPAARPKSPARKAGAGKAPARPARKPAAKAGKSAKTAAKKKTARRRK